MTFTDWPGAGPTPDPEAEGFRDDQIAAEKQRQIDAKKDQEERNLEAYEKYCAPPEVNPKTPDPQETPEPYGETPEPQTPEPDPQTPDEPYEPSTPPPPPSPDPQTSPYGSSTPTPTSPPPTSAYGSGTSTGS